MIRVWHYWTIRPNAPLVAAPVALLVAAMLRSSWAAPSLSLSTSFSRNVVLMLLCFLPQLWLCRRNAAAALIGVSYSGFLAEILAALGIGLVVVAPLFWVFPTLFPGPRVSLSALCLSALALALLRPVLRWMLRHKKLAEGFLVVGSGEMAIKFYEELAAWNTAKPAAFLSQNFQELSGAGMRVTPDQLRDITVRNGISRIVVAEPDLYTSEAVALAILDCKLQGIEVEQAIDAYEQVSSKVWLEGIRPDWLLHSYGFTPPKYYLQTKRILDVVCAFLLLLISAPVMALVALVIRLDSKGNALFRQERVGWHGKPFVLFKFRTMQESAERATGPVWARVDDPRITRAGRYLRKFRLDELPQLLNVVRGEMSLVGPRPERPHFVQFLRSSVPYYGLRHCVRPGITGWAQVLCRYGATVKDAYEKMQYDLYYAKHMSLGFDVRILMSTVLVVLFGRGR